MPTQIAPALSRVAIEQLANDIRTKFNCSGCYFDIVSFVEMVIPSIDDSFNYDYVEANELPNRTYAYYDSNANQIKVLTSVYEGACNDNGRDRFTIAHEVGHYFLHREGCLFARVELDVPAYRNPEWQANTFASALLIPKNQTKFMSIEQISNKCKVSHQAAEIAYKRNWQ